MRGQDVRLFDVLPGWAWAILCAGAIASAAVSSYRLQAAKAIHMEYVAGAEKAARQLTQQYRAIEQEIARAEEVNAAEVAALHLDLDRARSSADVQSVRMRDAISAAAKRARAGCADPAAADLRPPTDDAIGVLGRMLAEIDDYAGVVAEFADRSRIAGLACEAQYDQIRNATSKN